jgi:hypothetical protein
MAIVQILVTTNIMSDAPEFFPSGTWGSNSTLVAPLEFTEGTYQGNYENWGGFINNTSLNSFNNPGYAGYTTNWGGAIETDALNAFTNAAYAGYTTNFGGNVVNPIPDMSVVDINSVIDNPKDQFIYYKFKGYNPITMTYETWIEKENITGRPELFDPGGKFPTYERGPNLIAPSGAALVNITIVARWIQ